MWRLVHRLEFERDTTINEVKKGQVIRFFTTESPLEFCGFVNNVDRNYLELQLLTGLHRTKHRKFDKSKVSSCVEILSCPLFYRLRKTISGKEETDKLEWEKDGRSENRNFDRAKPRLLFRTPNDVKNPRVWHFLKIFPMKHFEYCTQVSINEEFHDRNVRDFDRIAFLAALFACRRLHLSLEEGYNRELIWINQTGPGEALSKITFADFSAWNKCIKGNLPIDRELFMSSLTGARNREFGVGRIKHEMLHNSKIAREAPSIYVIDEQIVPYTGYQSGLKKRLPKKLLKDLSTTL